MSKILLLEADRRLAKNTADFFSLAGHSVQIHSDPQTAVMAMDSSPPDIVVIDLLLAGRSGIEFLYELRSYPEWQRIPAIVTGRLSADELTLFSSAFRQLNVSKYLHKQSASLADILTEAQSLLQPAAV